MSERMSWAKFSWDAWENDPGLALCGMAAQGFWMRLLCLAAKSGGYVRIGDQTPTTGDLAVLVRAPESDVIHWLSELESKGVFSRTGRGVIYCRRMVRACKNRDNGSHGGNPILLNAKENRNPVIAESETESETEKKEPNGSAGSDDFEQAWKAFPETGRKRSSRQKSAPAWAKAAKRVGPRRLREAVGYYADSEDARKEGGKFVPGFDRWLRDGKWEHWLRDEPDLLSATIIPLDPWRFRCETFLRNNWWEEDWGPRPGREGCEAPPALLDEFGITLGHPDMLRRKALHQQQANG